MCACARCVCVHVLGVCVHVCLHACACARCVCVYVHMCLHTSETGLLPEL